MMRSKVWIVVGVGLSVLSAVPTLLSAIAAARRGDAWHGYSYYNLPLGTYTTLMLFAAVSIIGVVVLVRKIVSWLRRPPGE